MKKFVMGVVVGLVAGFGGCAAFVWQSGLLEPEVEMIGVEIHDTVYKDTLTLRVPVKEPVYYDAKWLRKAFEIPYTTRWRNYVDGYEIDYPSFMERKVDLRHGDRNLRVSYQDICMTVRTSDDDYDMTVREKYEAVSQAAVTRALADSAFTMAGKYGKNRLFFEKDIMLKPRTWLYMRVEFPAELTWAVDPLLHYVKDYEPR